MLPPLWIFMRPVMDVFRLETRVQIFEAKEGMMYKSEG
jgi:hypothetical protein